MEVKEQIEQLRKDLERHNYNYYVLNAPEISDQEFDRMMRELQDLEAAHPEYDDPDSPTRRVGSDLNQEFVQVPHRYPMLSLANTYNKQEVADFYERVRTGLEGEPFEICCEMKYDGLSISLTYEGGRLVRAVTRGDGVQGDDVTENVKTIRCIPLRLRPGAGYPQDFEIRGEILMPWTSFEALNREREEREEPLFANPRNAASGTLKSKNSSVVASRKLDAYLYYLLGDEIPGDGHYENSGENSIFPKLCGMSLNKMFPIHRSHIRFSEPKGTPPFFKIQTETEEISRDRFVESEDGCRSNVLSIAQAEASAVVSFLRRDMRGARLNSRVRSN